MIPFPSADLSLGSFQQAPVACESLYDEVIANKEMYLTNSRAVQVEAHTQVRLVKTRDWGGAALLYDLDPEPDYLDFLLCHLPASYQA